MQNLCHRISFWFSVSPKYIIKDLKYLIQPPPKSPATAFSLFVKQKTQGKTGVSAAQNMKQVSSVWNTMPAEQKEVYNNQYKVKKEAYEKEKSEYEASYVLPFKKVSSHTLFVKHLYQDKLINVQQKAPIQQYAKKVGELVKQKSPEDAIKYNEEAKKLSEERQKKIQMLTFPKRLYLSQAAYTKNHPNVLAEDRKHSYNLYIESWKLQVKKWLEDNKIELSIDDFIKLYNKEIEKKKNAVKQRKSIKQLSEESSEVKPKRKVVNKALNDAYVWKWGNPHAYSLE